MDFSEKTDNPENEAFSPKVVSLIFGYEELPLPDYPTKARPGTLGKIVVLAERIKHGQAFWHPDDATWNGATGAVIRGAHKRHEPTTNGGAPIDTAQPPEP